MNLQYSELAAGNRLIRLKGKLDIQGVAQVEKKIAGHIAGEAVTLLVDFSQVDYIASIGIRLLLTIAKTLKSRGGQVLLFGAMPLVEEVLSLSGLSQVIPIHANLEVALASLVNHA